MLLLLVYTWAFLNTMTQFLLAQIDCTNKYCPLTWPWICHGSAHCRRQSIRHPGVSHGQSAAELYWQSICHWSQFVSPITVPRFKLVSSWRSLWKWPLSCHHNCNAVLWPRRSVVMEIRLSRLVHLLGGMLWRTDYCKYWRQLCLLIYWKTDLDSWKHHSKKQTT